jgi:hypothetical protein
MRSINSTTLSGLPFQLDTTSRDYTSLRDALIRFITDITPEWTDRSSGDLGMNLLEVMAYIGDTLNYHIDRAQNESYLSTAQELQNVKALLELIGYQMSTGAGSTVPLCVVCDDAVTLPVGTVIKAPGITGQFELIRPVFLPAAGIYAPSSVIAITQEGLGGLPVVANDDLVGYFGNTIEETIGASNGRAFQEFTLSHSDVSFSSVSPLYLEIDGEIYQPVSSFLDSEPDTAVFIYRINAEGLVSVRFGDGISGKIPPINQDIEAYYRTGSGVESNSFGVNTLTNLSPATLGVVRVFNPVTPSGGLNAESIEEARLNGPLSLRALDRAVTLEDFETLARLTPSGGVKAARADGSEPYRVRVYISAEGENPIPTGRWYPELEAGTGLIGAVGRWLLTRKPVTTQLEVLAPTAVRLFTRLRVSCLRNILRNEAKTEVLSSIQIMLDDINDVFGRNLPISRLIQIVENTRGVDFVNVLEFRRVPELYYLKGSEYSILGSTIDVTPSVDATPTRYKIIWRNSQQFTMQAEHYGDIRESYSSRAPILYTANTDSDVFFYNFLADEDTPARVKQLSFSVTIGNNTPSRGDVWGFCLDAYVGNINLNPNELIVPTLTIDQTLDQTSYQIEILGGI